ncbi:iduronate 2-sulfatase [Wenyingzhuangia heitensis]|uniref:Iduronate 2-sulfatase n=1 Tax=Wenyingzhuangia heitensis TaxID=1487859 RepID=A0ABX0U917_9FLAO|nr:sulfatase [Wenyingzhuangia heitensis]NIJ45329.1 iduronate 2-sulfatase [Wenyingzhuangia heitensis]
MENKKGFTRLWVLIVVLFVGVKNTSIAQSAKQPNVILIMLDDLNDYTGFLKGHPQVQTPNMDALAKEGIVFNNAHTNAPICAPSRSSMLTGIYPHTSKIFWFSKWHQNNVLSNSKTLMQFMGDCGYATFGTGKLMHDRVKSEWNEFGVEHNFGPYAFDGKRPVKHPSVPKEYYQNKNDGLYASLADVPNIASSNNVKGYKGWYDVKNRKPFKYIDEENRDLLSDELSANWAVDKIIELEKSKSSKPFFLAVGFVKPHTPLVAPQKYFDLYPLETLQLPKIKENDIEDTFYRSTFKWTPPWASHYEELKASYTDFNKGLRTYLQAYLACVSFADAQVGKVMTALRKSEFDKNTIVILVSDHGYNHGEKEFIYKNNLWEKTTRIPMIVRAPEFKENAGQVVNHPVSLVDVYPTITDLCGINNASNVKNDKGAVLSGFSMKPFLEHPKKGTWKGPGVALTVVRGDFKSNEVDSQSYSVKSKDYRYIRYVNGKEELYDHTKDPNEWTNLAENRKYRKIKKDLEHQLDMLLK